MTTTAYEVPLAATPQQFYITLGGVQYQLTTAWNWPGQVWQLTIATAAGVTILDNIPLVTGCDLLAQYAYLELGGQLIAFTDNDLSQPPTFSALGTSGHLYFQVVS